MQNQQKEKGKEIYNYTAPWLVYAMNWSNQKDGRKVLGIGSFQEDYVNKIQVLALNEQQQGFNVLGSIDHPYPPTKLMFTPNPSTTNELFATSGDYLRLWQLGPQGITAKTVLDVRVSFFLDIKSI